MVAQDEKPEWETSGYLDFYYSRFDEAGDDLPMAYVNHFRNPTLTAAQVQIKRNPTKKLPVGMTLSLIDSFNADANNALEPGGTRRYNWIDEAYISFAANDRISFDIGKFDTWIGMETKVSGDNLNYSRSRNWELGQPIYHTGARVNIKLNDDMKAGLYAVRGWNEVEDSNDEMSFGASFKWNRDKLGIGLNYYGGTEGETVLDGPGFSGNGFGTGVETDVTLFNALVTFNATDKLVLGAEGTWGEAEIGSSKFKWNGFAGYLGYRLCDKWSFGARAERFEDKDGIRTFENDFEIDTLTANLDFHVEKNLMLRFEWRKDDYSFFDDGDGKGGGTFSDKRTAFTLGCFIRF